MSRLAPKKIQDQWKEKIVNQSQSGLSIAAWCRQNNIAAHIFYYWRDKLAPNSLINRGDFKEISK